MLEIGLRNLSPVHMLFVGLVILISDGTVSIAADTGEEQEGTDRTVSNVGSTVPYKWSFTFGFSSKNNIGVADDINDGLIRAGFVDDWHASTWLGEWSKDSPNTRTKTGSGSAAVGYALNRNWGIRLVVDNARNLFESEGRRFNDDTLAATTVEIGSDFFSLSMIAEYSLTPALRFGLGPAYHRINLGYRGYQESTQGQIQDVYESNDTYSAVGIVFEAAIVLPARSRVFLFMEYKRHQIATVDLGPYQFVGEIPIGLSHSMWTWGMGFRLH